MGKRKIRFGRVVSDKMDKTVIVAVESFKSHPLYKKNIRKVKKYKVHDENKSCRIGDKVEIIETRPLSKEKRWRVAKVISKGYSVASPNIMELDHDEVHKPANVITTGER